jgi:nucleotide-binding universal stress UspA family protein
MYQRILVPLDESHLAEQVLAWVGILAQGMHSRVELLRVMEPPPPGIPNSAHGIYPHRVSASIASHAQDYRRPGGTSEARRAVGIFDSPGGKPGPLYHQ